jgi:transposase
MKPYSQDLRDRVLATVKETQLSQAKIAKAFKISKSVLEKWLRRQHETGACVALPHGGGHTRALAGCEAFIRAQVKKQPDSTLEELCARVANAKGVPASPSMMCRELRRLRLPRKKSLSTIINAKRPACNACGKIFVCRFAMPARPWRNTSNLSMTLGRIWA